MTSMARILKVLHVQQLPNNFCSISMRAMICAIISRKVLFENRGNSIIAKYHWIILEGKVFSLTKEMLVSLEKGKIQFWYSFINRLDPCKSLGTLKEMMIKP